jgi:hypothetical protein
MILTAADYEARRQLATAFRKEDRPLLNTILGSNWSAGLDLYRLTDHEYFLYVIKLFNKRVGVANFAPADKPVLFVLVGIK